MKDWLNHLFETIDKKDSSGFVRFLAENASFRFGSAQAVCGKENIQKAVESFFSTIKSLTHCILQVWEEDNIVICEGEVTYIRADGKQATVPFMNLFKMENGLIADYRIYIDILPLYS